LTVPVKVGISLKNYYELLNADLTYHDSTFGFFDIGGLFAVPLSTPASRFGAWSIHGGADVLELGDTARAFNRGIRTKVVGLVGIGLTY
jgi:hypothetical protein